METKFEPVIVSRPVFLEAGRSFLGCAYSEVTTTDSTNCTGLVLKTLQKVGLLKSDFDPNLSEFDAKRKIAFLWRMASENSEDIGFSGLLHEGEPIDKLLPGDLLFSCWRDVDPRRSDLHHVNIYTEAKQGHYGSFLQCVSREHGGSGFVSEVDMNSLDWSRIEKVLRFRALVGGEA
jgi:hypothetical protein